MRKSTLAFAKKATAYVERQIERVEKSSDKPNAPQTHPHPQPQQNRWQQYYPQPLQGHLYNPPPHSHEHQQAVPSYPSPYATTASPPKGPASTPPTASHSNAHPHPQPPPFPPDPATPTAVHSAPSSSSHYATPTTTKSHTQYTPLPARVPFPRHDYIPSAPAPPSAPPVRTSSPSSRQSPRVSVDASPAFSLPHASVDACLPPAPSFDTRINLYDSTSHPPRTAVCGEDSETVSASGRPLASGDMPPAAQRVSGNTAAPPAAMQPTHVPCEETADCNLQIQAAVQSVYGSAESRFAKQPHTASQTPDSCAGSVRASTQVPYTEHVPSTPLLPQDTLPQNRARVVSASDKFGRLAMAEARKGLSRVLQTGCIEDLESFALQLQTADKAACAADYEECDDIPVFALTYRHADAAEGCGFAFGDGLHCSQWVNFVVCMKEIAFCGIGKIRVWVDQCMWIREGGYVGRGGWAHTGVVPYVLWPVISLGYKRPGAERSVVTERRMWPFLEEVAGLWSMGVMITEEMRDMTDERSLRRTCSFNRRTQLEPERAMEVLLLNVFHGACDELEMGCKSDLEELEQMAVLNVFADSEDIFVGSDWRERAAGIRKKAYGIAIFSIRLSLRSETLGGYDVYIDASRKAQGKTWNGLVEFLSGHSSGLEATENDWGLLRFGMGKYNIVADNMELLLLELGIHTQRKSAGLWLIVCMEGQSSNFSRGTVRWTKVAMGKSGCNMGRALKKGNYLVLGKCLEEQIGERVRIKRVTNTDMLPVPHVVTTDSSLQSATPAESLHASAESSFPEVPHTPSLHPNQIAVPVPPPTALPHMAYVPSRKLLPPDTVPQAYARIASATFELGALAVSEARKGLSRVLQTGNDKDLELFAGQLQTADKAACESDYGKKDKVPVFALSYQQFDPPPGSRFKFGDGLQCRQWANFVVCMKEIAFCGIPQIRVWLDQCLWLRDESQGCWAHTGIVPYVLWPVISLGYKRPGAERTVLTERRMWPFVEEVAGLWSMGVLIAEEMRDIADENSLRRSSSFSRRARLEPEKAMELLLLNVFHGACEELETGWKKDVEELEEMAVWNVFADSRVIFVGSDWKERVAGVNSRGYRMAIYSLGLPVRDEYRGGDDVYIDASRKVQVETWNGLTEFVSGRSSGHASTQSDWSLMEIAMRKYNVVADDMELQLLSVRGFDEVWLIVCMEGQSSGFSRGKVRWTKVASGKAGCSMAHAFNKRFCRDWSVLNNCLEEQIGEKVRVKHVTNMSKRPIQWA